MPPDPGIAAIATAIITLGRSLVMQMNAEGIETEQRSEMLLATGCDEGQGYLLGRPMPTDAFKPLFRLQR